jgi:hypothetical protein
MPHTFTTGTPLLLSLTLAAVATLAPFAAHSGSALERMTAATHAGYAAESTTLEVVHKHLHHTINCLVGPKGDGFDATQEDPCASDGNGAIPDETNDSRKAELEAAAAEAKRGLAATDLAAAQASARKTETMLQEVK